MKLIDRWNPRQETQNVLLNPSEGAELFKLENEDGVILMKHIFLIFMSGHSNETKWFKMIKM